MQKIFVSIPLALTFLVLPAHCQQTQTDPSTTPPPTQASTTEATAKLGDSTQLQPIKIEKAAYPEEASATQLQGRVWVVIHVSETGDVGSVDVVSGDPILAKAAVTAAMKWKFKPFIKGGKPVKASTKIPFDFAFGKNIVDTKPSDPVRVSAGVLQGMVLHKVAPEYPEALRSARVQGTVLLHVLIGKDGLVKDISVISGQKQLTPAAIGAVQQWRYRPYLLNNEPVEVSSEVKVNFTMANQQ
jgi:TonB family protein